MKKLTPLQARFVEQYLVDLNASKAALRAGYSAGCYGRRLINFPHIKQALDCSQKRIQAQTGVTIEKVINELTDLHKRTLENEDLSTAARCLELLGRHVGAWEKNNKQKRNTVNVVMNFAYKKGQ